MKLEKDTQLFFGCKVDSKMREALALARPGDRKYFEGESDEFLRVCIAGENEKWIGKLMKGGVNTAEVEDIQRNVASILRRISANLRISASSVKIFVATPSDEPIVIDEPEPADKKEDSGGPYIDY